MEGRSASRQAAPQPLTERAAVVAIVSLALAVRVVYVLQARANPYFDAPPLDAGFFVTWARDVAAGQWLPPGVVPRPPLYAWFLGAILRAGGGGLLAPRLVQCGLGALNVFLVWRIARSCASRAAALAAAGLAAASWVLVYYDGELLRETLAITLNLAALLALLRWTRLRTDPSALLAGVAFGAAALVRPQVLAALLATVAWLVATRRLPWRQALVAAAATLAPILPITWHNAAAGAGLVLVSPESGQALWIGNNPAADGVTAVAPGTRRGFEEQLQDARAEAERALGRSLSEAEVSSYWRGRALSWIEGEPAAFARLTARKLALLASRHEFGGNPDEPAFLVERFAPITRFLPVGFGITFALALAGIVVALRTTGACARALLIFAAVYALTVVAVLASGRHRLPIVPVLDIFAGIACARAFAIVKAREHAQAALFAAVVAVGYAITCIQPFPAEASRANGLVWLAIAAQRDGDSARALALSEEACRLRPDFGYAHAARASALHRLGRDGEARTACEAAVRLDPSDLSSWMALGEIDLAVGLDDEAWAVASRVVGSFGHVASSWYLRGRVHARRGDLQGALQDFRASLERDPQSFNAAYASATVLEDLGRPADAREAYLGALRGRARAAPAFVRATLEALERLSTSPEERTRWSAELRALPAN